MFESIGGDSAVLNGFNQLSHFLFPSLFFGFALSSSEPDSYRLTGEALQPLFEPLNHFRTGSLESDRFAFLVIAGPLFSEQPELFSVHIVDDDGLIQNDYPIPVGGAGCFEVAIQDFFFGFAQDFTGQGSLAGLYGSTGLRDIATHVIGGIRVLLDGVALHSFIHALSEFTAIHPVDTVKAVLCPFAVIVIDIGKIDGGGGLKHFRVLLSLCVPFL
jgi:hypothetical protein